MDTLEDAPWGTLDTRFDPIHSAARERDLDEVRREVSSGVDVDVPNGRAPNGDGGNTALWFAAQGPWPGGLEIVEFLVLSGAEVNRRCEHGRTALHMAAAWGHLDIVRFLIGRGGDAGLRDDLDLTPVGLARSRIRADVDDDPRLAVVSYLESI